MVPKSPLGGSWSSYGRRREHRVRAGRFFAAALHAQGVRATLKVVVRYASATWTNFTFMPSECGSDHTPTRVSAKPKTCTKRHPRPRVFTVKRTREHHTASSL